MTPSEFTEQRIAVIVPCYNVAATLEGVVRTLPAWVAAVVLVDDGSTDDTAGVMARIRDPRIHVVRHEKNRGVGAAVLTGYAKAETLGMRVFVKMDGDGQMRPDDLESLVEPVVRNRADYAKGDRFTHYASLKKMPVSRRFGNALLSFLTKCVSGYWNIFDVTNGFTALRASTYRKLDMLGVHHGYFFETSMLIELNTVLARVVDVDMPSVYQGEKSHLKVGRVLLCFPPLLLRGLVRRFWRRYVVRDFGILSLCVLTGLPLFGFGVTYGITLWLNPPHAGEPTPAGTVMLAALSIILGFQLLLTSLILDIVFMPRPARSHRE